MDINVRLDELFARNLVPRGPYQALIQTEIWRSRARMATGITRHREEEEEAEKGATLGIDLVDGLELGLIVIFRECAARYNSTSRDKEHDLPDV